MKKYGIIYCGYNTEDYTLDSIRPFLQDQNCVVSAVSVPFAEYKNIDSFEDGTTDILRELVSSGELKYLVDSPKFISEADARNLALDNLKKYDLDYIWLVDSDEFYTKRDIEEIQKYVESSSKNLFKISLRNYVFDTDHYLEEPFCPPRIFKTKIVIPELENFIELDKFYWDNDICYIFDNKYIKYDDVENLTVIPESVAIIKHFTWLNDKIGKRKVEYQHKHFGHCGYRWNSEKESLEFDLDFHKANNLEIPIVRCVYDD